MWDPCNAYNSVFVGINCIFWANIFIRSSISSVSLGRSSTASTLDALKTDEDPKEIDFFTKQARLQIEARMALAQAKDIAHMQMEVNESCFLRTAVSI